MSWIRRRDWYSLAADKKIYSHDERFRVSFVDAPESTWTLLIKFIRKDDEGIYDCQVHTSHTLAFCLKMIQLPVREIYKKIL